jgi:pimeloyl-ACP methyl ester carboxylesterase
VACAHQLHARILGSQLHIIPDAEHGLLTNEPERTRWLMLEFLSRAARQGQTSAAR